MIIDAHAHVWQLARGDYGWLTPQDEPLYRDFTAVALTAEHDSLGISGCVLVQAAPTIAETEFLLDVAATMPTCKAVVGWIDMAADDAPAQLDHFARHRHFRGIRPMLQDIADPDWVQQPALAPAFAALEARGLTFDALIRAAHVPAILAVARRHPELKIVVDHGAKPTISDRDWPAWADAIEALATCPTIFCKLSGLITEAAPGGDLACFDRWASQLLGAFGPNRLMWGSDWPVVLRNGDLCRWYSWSRAFVAPHGADAIDAIFGGTAARFYGFIRE